MYRLHMQSRSFEDQTAMREDIRRINLYIHGVEQNYTIVDRLGEGKLLFFPLPSTCPLTPRMIRYFLLGLQSHRQELCIT